MKRYRLRSLLKVTTPTCLYLDEKAEPIYRKPTRLVSGSVTPINYPTSSYDDHYLTSHRNTPLTMVSISDCATSSPSVSRSRPRRRSFQQSMAIYNFRRHNYAHKELKLKRPANYIRSPSALSISRNVPASPVALTQPETRTLKKDFGAGIKTQETLEEPSENVEAQASFQRNEKDEIMKRILLKNRSPFRICSIVPKQHRVKLRCPRSPVQSNEVKSPHDKSVSMHEGDFEVFKQLQMPILELKFQG